MRRIAFSCGALSLLTLTTVALCGDAVDATRPTNVAEISALLRRIEHLERRVRELEARTVTPTTPAPISIAPQNHDGVLRADQVKIYSHYQRMIPDVQTAGEVRYPAHQPAVFRSGGVTITR